MLSHLRSIEISMTCAILHVRYTHCSPSFLLPVRLPYWHSFFAKHSARDAMKQSRSSKSPSTILEAESIGSTGYEENSFDSTAPSTRRGWAAWELGTLGCAWAAMVVLILNISFLIWGEATTGFISIKENDGKRTLHDGSCDKTKTLNTIAHLAINVLGTVLLGASNYCMQCMSSPTREEVDKAHAKRQCMDIGVPSIRNLNGVGSVRKCLWLVLGLSSAPLHLL